MIREFEQSLFGRLKKMPVYSPFVLIAYLVMEELLGLFLSGASSILDLRMPILRLILIPIYAVPFLWVVVFFKVQYSKYALGIEPKEGRILRLTFRSMLPAVLFSLMALLFFFLMSALSSMTTNFGLELIGTVVMVLIPWLILLAFLVSLYIFVFFTDYVMFENSNRIALGGVFRRMYELSSQVKGYRLVFFGLISAQVLCSSLFVFGYIDYNLFSVFRILSLTSVVVFQMAATHFYCMQFPGASDSNLSSEQ